MGRKSPMPPDFFPRPALADATRVEFIHRGQAALVDLVEKSRLMGGPIAWAKVHESSRGVTTYRGIDPSTLATVFLRVKADIDASLGEAAQLVRPPRQYDHTYHRDVVVDAQTLYTVATPTRQHPHNSIRLQWFAIDPKLLGLRDFCVLEYQDDFVREGTRGFGRCFHSVDLPVACPDLQASCGYTRANLMYGGDIFTENAHRPGILTLFRLYHHDLRGRGQRFLAWASQRTLSRHVAEIAGHIRLERMARDRLMASSSAASSQRSNAQHPFGAPFHVDSTKKSSHCSVCRNRFFPLFCSTKYKCVQCSEVVCKHCQTPVTVRQSSDQSAAPLARVCTLCSSISQSQRVQRGSLPLRVSLTTTAYSRSHSHALRPTAASNSSSIRLTQPPSSTYPLDASAHVVSLPRQVRPSYPAPSLVRCQSDQSAQLAPRVISLHSTERRGSPTPSEAALDGPARNGEDDAGTTVTPLLDATCTMREAPNDRANDGVSSVVSSFVVLDVQHNPPSPQLWALIQHLQAREASWSADSRGMPPFNNNHASHRGKELASPQDFASDAATIATDNGECSWR